MKRRHLLAASTALLTSPLGLPFLSARADTTGVTDKEIKIGHTIAYSGPASARMASSAKPTRRSGTRSTIKAALPDAKSISSRSTMATRRRKRSSRCVASSNRIRSRFCSTRLARRPIRRSSSYVNQKRGAASVSCTTGADKWGDYQHFPWTIGYQPSYRTEAQIYTKYILKEHPNAKIAILYQNDDFGKDYPLGVKDVLGDKFVREDRRANL